LGTSVAKAGDVVKRAALRSNLKALADMFIDPQSVAIIRNANKPRRTDRYRQSAGAVRCRGWRNNVRAG
jgi:hypothetical protein